MSNELKHTPGPWLVSQYTVYALHGEPKRNRFFAQIQRGREDDASEEELRANARLMGAAADLLDALRRAVPWIETSDEGEEATRRAYAAIDKATGNAA